MPELREDDPSIASPNGKISSQQLEDRRLSGAAQPHPAPEPNPTATEYLRPLLLLRRERNALAGNPGRILLPSLRRSERLTNTFQYYQPQFSSLYGWQTRGNSNYNGLQLTLRHAMAAGLQFDFNYTFSKAIDVGSNAERVNGFESGGVAFNSQVINAFSPNLWRAVSDFDTTHQLNANWIWDVPFGRQRHWGGGSNGVVNAVFGGLDAEWPVPLDQWLSILGSRRQRVGHRLRTRRNFFCSAEAKDRRLPRSGRRSERVPERDQSDLHLLRGDGSNTNFRATYAGRGRPAKQLPGTGILWH